MQKEVMVALISLAGTIAGSFGGVLASSKLTAYRLRLLENKVDKHNRFAERLPVAVTRQLRNLLVEHVEMTGQIIRTLKSGDKENYEQQIREWYANANQIATLLADQNPYFAGKETRNLLLNYLDMTREIIEHQMNGEYDQSIDTFRDLSDLVLELADYLARGLLAR